MSATATREAEAAMADGADGASNGESPDDGETQRRSLEDLAAQEPDADAEIEQFTLFGTGSRLNSKVGGPKVTASAARFTAKRQELPGQFELGETVRGTFVGRVKDLQFPTRANSDGSFDVTRVHVIELSRLNQAEDVPEEFAALDGRGRGEDDGELERALARIRELEALLEA
jgi:hypothetical protein